MPSVHIKGINTVTRTLAGGKRVVYYYHRASGQRLPGPLGSPEFMAGIAAIEQSASAKKRDTIAHLIHLFCKSADWTRLRESTRAIMRLNLKAVEDRFGDMPLAALEDRRCRIDFLDWRDELAVKHPRAADAKMSALTRVLSFGAEYGHIDANPLPKIRKVYTVDRSDKIWLPEHVDAFAAAAPEALVRAMMLALHTGQRQGDLISLVWSNYDGTALTLRQKKPRDRARARVYIPCTAALKAFLDALPREPGVTTILVRDNGMPWTSDSFKRAWRQACARVPAIGDLHFHDLRGTAITMLSEAGCATQEVAAITGHTLAGCNRILDTYLARTRGLAEGAIAKLEEHRRNQGAKRAAKRTAVNSQD